MAIDPIKIPQNVYIEDRIVGPLTLKQIITVAIGCGFSYALYSLLLKSYGAIALPVTILVWVPGALSFVFAFIKINDVSIFRIMLLMIERINKPATRVWTPRRGIAVNIRTFNGDKAVEAAPTALESSAHGEKFDELSSILDLSMPDLVPSKAGGQKTAMSPLEEPVDDTPMRRPVDRSRVEASPLQGQTMDTVSGKPTIEPSAPTKGAVSIFRDISPRHA